MKNFVFTRLPGFPATILRLGKGICYVSEAVAAPFSSWHCGIKDQDL